MRSPAIGRRRPASHRRVVLVVAAACGLLATCLPTRPSVAQEATTLSPDAQMLLDQRMSDLAAMADGTVEPSAPTGLESPEPGPRPVSAEVPPQPTDPSVVAEPERHEPSLAYLDHILATGSVPVGLGTDAPTDDEPVDGLTDDRLTDAQLDQLVAAGIADADVTGPTDVPADPLAPVDPGEVPLPAGDYTPNSVQVENADGSVTTSVSAGGRFNETDEGWATFDPTVAPAGPNPDVVGTVDTATGDVEFGVAADSLVSLSTDRGEITIGTDDLVLTEPPVVAGDQVTYTDATARVSIGYQATPSGVKELVILAGPDSPRVLTFVIEDPDAFLGVPVEQPDGSWQFVDPETDRVRAVIPTPAGHDATAIAEDGTVQPLAWDADAADLLVEAVDGGFEATLTVDDEWLEGRTYPVAIDPTLVMQTYAGQGPTTEGYVYTGTGCPSGGCTFVPSTTYGFVVSGVTSGLTVAGLERWTLWDDSHLSPNRHLPPRAVVTSATYGIPLAGCYDGFGPACGNTASVDVYGLTGAWTTSDNFTTITGLQASTPTDSNPTLLFDAPNSWDVTDLVQDWADDPDANFGMAIRAPPVGAGNAGGYWYGSSGTTNDPTLTVNWTYSDTGPPTSPSATVVPNLDGSSDIEVDWEETTTGTWASDYIAQVFERQVIDAWVANPVGSPTPVQAHSVVMDDGDATEATFTDLPPGNYLVAITATNGGGVFTSVSGDVAVGLQPVVDVEVAPLSGSTDLAPGDGAQINVTVTNPNDVPLLSDIVIGLPDSLTAIDQFFVDNGVDPIGPCEALVGVDLVCDWVDDPDHVVDLLDLELAPDGEDGAFQTISFLVQAVSSELACVDAVVGHHVSLGTFIPVQGEDELRVCGNGLGLEPWWSYVGRPVGPAVSSRVNVANGNLVVQQDNSTSVQGHGRQGYVLRSTYNSETPPLTAVGAFGSIGAGWTLNVSTAGETAGLITPTGLSVPSLSAALPQLTAPLATVLVDRDGTRHLFTPHSVEANVVVSLDDQEELDTLLDSNPATNVATGVMSDADFPVLGSVLNDILPPAGTGPRLNVCVDTIYEAPRGVHLGMWRFIGVQSPTGEGCESTQGANGIVALGYATMRPDRVRQVFSATGQLVSQFDGAGNELRYRYALDVPSTLLDAQNALDGALDGTVGIDLGLDLEDIPLVAGLTLGPLMAIYEPGVCEEGGLDPFGLVRTGASGECNRSMTFDYAPFSFGIGIEGVSITVTDPAHRTIQYDTAGLLAPRLVLTTVRDSDGTELETWEYGYGADEECGGQQLQLCSITAPYDGDDSDGITANDSLETAENQTTQFDYEGEQTLLSAAPSLTEITERPVASATIAGASTNAHTFFEYGEGETLVTRGVRGTQFGAIDEFGRVHDEQQGVSDGDELTAVNRSTERVWDGDTVMSAVVRCQLPVASSGNPDSDLDHHLCQETRHAFAGDFTGPTDWEDHDRVTSFTYNPIGQPTSSTVENGSADLVTTMGYDIQYRNADSSVDAESDAPTGSGGVTRGARHDDHLYAVSDLVSTLSPRGNDGRSDWSGFLSQIDVDAATTEHPNRPVDDGVCGVPAHNTGLVCSMTGPRINGPDSGASYTPAGERPLTTFTYDTYGQLLTETSPKANDPADDTVGTESTEYRYYDDDQVDLTGTVNAGGWLASVHDTADVAVADHPDGNFVTFAYDRAGNPVRSWDRDATTRNLEDSIAPPAYRAAEASSPPGFAETRNGGGSSVDAFENPWRYSHTQIDQLENTTRFGLDLRGNQWTVTQPRGVQSGTTDFDIQQTFDARDRLLTTHLPEERAQGLDDAKWRYEYDESGNVVTATDPNGHRTAQDYDPVDRQRRIRFTRGDPADVYEPAGCNADDERLPSGRIYCEASVAYDGLDQVVNQTDPDGGTTWVAFDAAGRTVSSFAERNENGITWVRSATVLDRDGNPVVSCRPREFTEGSTECTSNSVHATHRVFDPAGQVLREHTYRTSSLANGATRLEYDHDGNVIEAINPNDAETRLFWDLEGRQRHTVTPRGDLDLVTSTTFSPAGDVLTVQQPDGDWPDGTFAGDREDVSGDDPSDDIFSLYSYDAVHRVIDSVDAASSIDGIDSLLPNDPVSDVETDDSTMNLARVENLRTRNVYDVDGNVIAVFDPRAFYSTGSADPLEEPQRAFMTRVDWDRNGRPIAQWQPYWDGREDRDAWSPIFDTSTDAERHDCPETGGSYQPDSLPDAPTYPGGIGVCATRVSYDPAGNLASIRNPSSGPYSSAADPGTDSADVAGDSGNQNRVGDDSWYRHPNRYELRTYTDDNLAHLVNRPNPAYSNTEAWRDGDYDPGADSDPEVDPRVDATAMHYDGSGRSAVVENVQAHFRTTMSYTPDGLPDIQLGQRDDTPGSTPTWRPEHATEWAYNADGQALAEGRYVRLPPLGSGPAPIRDVTMTDYFADGLVRRVAQDPTRNDFNSGGITFGARYETFGTSALDDEDIIHAYAYDDVGNAVTLVGPRAVGSDSPGLYTTHQTFTSDNLLETTETPVLWGSDRTTTYAYDALGRKTSQEVCGPDTAVSGFPITCDSQSISTNRDGSMHHQTGYGGETISYRYNADGTQFSAEDSTSHITTTTHQYLNGWPRSVIDTGTGATPGATASPPTWEDHQTDFAYFGDGVMRARYYRDESSPISLIETTAMESTDVQSVTDARQSEELNVWNYFWETPPTLPGVKLVTFQRLHDQAGRVLWEASGVRADPPGFAPDTPSTTGTTPATLPPSSPTTPTEFEIRAFELNEYNEDGTVAARAVTDRPEDDDGIELGVWRYDYDALNRQAFSDDPYISGTDDGQECDHAQCATQSSSDTTFDYGYDGAGRMTSINNNGQSTAETVTYNRAGFRTNHGNVDYVSRLDNTINYACAEGFTDSTHCLNYEYDGQGRMVTDGCRNYTYDGFDRTTEVEYDASSAACGSVPADDAAYAYDGLDRQVHRDEDTELPTGLYYQGGTASLVVEDTGHYLTDTAYYLDEQGVTQAQHSDFVVQFLHDDGHGNVSLITNDEDPGTAPTAPAVIDCSVRYDPWGNTRPRNTPIPVNQNPNRDRPAPNPCAEETATEPSTNSVLYRDSRRDGSSGNYQWGSRTYDPDDASWLTPDTARGAASMTDLSIGVDPLTQNRYSYVNGDPINFADPSGHRPIGCQNTVGHQCTEPDPPPQSPFPSGEGPGGSSSPDVVAEPAPEGIAACGARLSCSYGYIESLDIDRRRDYLEWLQGSSLGRRYGVESWWNAVLGVMDFQAGDGLVEPGNWFSAANAGILYNVQNGFAMAEGVASAGQETEPAGLWATFLRARGRGASDGESVTLWANAEQASTDFGVEMASELGREPNNGEDWFRRITDYMRDWRRGEAASPAERVGDACRLSSVPAPVCWAEEEGVERFQNWAFHPTQRTTVRVGADLIWDASRGLAGAEKVAQVSGDIVSKVTGSLFDWPHPCSLRAC